MEAEFTITTILAIFSLVVNIYQVHKEDKTKAKIKSWLEMSRGIHSLSQNEQQEGISRVTYSLVQDLEDELKAGRIWHSVSFIIFILAIGILIGMLIFKSSMVL